MADLAKQPLQTQPVIGVVVNRVLRARSLFDLLRRTYAAPEGEPSRAEVCLVIGPAREADREAIGQRLEAIKTGRDARAQRLRCRRSWSRLRRLKPAPISTSTG